MKHTPEKLRESAEKIYHDWPCIQFDLVELTSTLKAYADLLERWEAGHECCIYKTGLCACLVKPEGCSEDPGSCSKARIVKEEP